MNCWPERLGDAPRSTQEHEETVPSPDAPVSSRNVWSWIASEPTRWTSDTPAASSSMRITPASEPNPPYTIAPHPDARIPRITETGIASIDGIVLRSTTSTEDIRPTSRVNSSPYPAPSVATHTPSLAPLLAANQSATFAACSWSGATAAYHDLHDDAASGFTVDSENVAMPAAETRSPT